MKKILAIAPYKYLPWFSGGQKLIGKFLEYLGKEVDLTVIGTVNNDWSLAKNYNRISLLKKSFSRYYDLSLTNKIVSLIKKNSFEAVIWEHPYYWWLAKRVKKRTGITTIIHTHNIEHQRFRSTGRWWWEILKMYEKKSFKGADILFFVSDEDRNFAITQWKIDAAKCFTIPFGIDMKNYPSDKVECKKKVTAIHNIDENEKIFLFNGWLNYKPNLDAVMKIIQEINPLLLKSPLKYKIIICGKGLPQEMNQLKEYSDKNIIYAGFVDDIETYFKAANLFLNPVLRGGGIKTKIVEAIGFGTTVISTQAGATGIEKDSCGEKLIVVSDNDWNNFVSAVLQNADHIFMTPAVYYEHYYWENVVKKVKHLI